jgi:KipI family sensor histidine kinase inhibitor
LPDVAGNAVSITAFGDAALLVRLGGGEEAYDVAAALADSLATESPDGVTDAVAAYAAVAVYFDARFHTHPGIAALVRRHLGSIRDTRRRAPEPITIAVSYDGPDLSEVCTHLGITHDEFVELHAGAEYTARAIGFVPGFAYLGELHERLRLPRRDTPRVRVPPGSVAIAGASTAVYPFATPGGWHLVGSTPAVMFDARRTQPALITAGARVRFSPR